MSFRRLLVWASFNLGLLASGSASAGLMYRIIDHIGNSIQQDLGQTPHQMASLTIDKCGLVLTGNVLTVACDSAIREGQSVRGPGFTTTSTGMRGCTNQPYPLIRYSGDELCFEQTYNANTAPIEIEDTYLRICTPTNPWTSASRCVPAFRFVAAPTAPGGLVLSRIIVAFGLANFDSPTRPCLEPPGSTVCTVHQPQDGSTYPHPYVTVVYGPAAPTLSCAGFQSPFDQALALKKANRAIPLKAQLFNLSNVPVTPSNLNAAAPIVEVSHASGTSPAVDVTASLASVGQSSTGNQFSFDATSGNWWFNLDSTPYAAAGTYTVTLKSGDATKYTVNANCTGTFVRQ